MKHILTFLLIGFCSLAHGDVTFYVKEYLLNVAVEIHVAGEIRESDIRELESGISAARQFAIARRKKAADPHFVLNSRGGDVAAGAKIGSWARAQQASAEVEAECSSACVLILAGAVHRRIKAIGKVGIHRIYFPGLKANATYAQVRDKMAGVDQFLTTYLREMDIPTSLLEEMKSVPSDSVRYLTALELQRYRLTGSDPAHQERADGQVASQYGLTREEYYRRKARVDAICREGTFMDLDCWEAVLKGKK